MQNGGGTHESQTDEFLLSALRRQDEFALRELVNRYSRAVYGLCHRILKNVADAEEVTSEVFSELWEQSSRYDPERATARTYILLMARSRSLDRIRAIKREHDRRERSFIDEIPDMRGLPDQQIHLDEMAKTIAAGLDSLTDLQRQAIELAFFEGMTHKEIADAMQLPLGSIKSHIRRGLIRLRNLLPPPEMGGA